VRTWRRLRTLGAMALKSSVYLLFGEHELLRAERPVNDVPYAACGAWLGARTEAR
jgi:hypothetical protein